MKLKTAKTKQMVSYLILFILLLIPLPFSYVAVTNYSEGSDLQREIKELHRRTIELSYILNRHIMMEQDDLEGVYQRARSEYATMVRDISERASVSLPQREPELMEKFSTLAGRWEEFIYTLDSAMEAGDQLVFSRRNVGHTTLPMINALNELVVAFEGVNDRGYNKSINMAGLGRMLTAKMNYALERYLSNWEESGSARSGEEGPMAVMGRFEELLVALREGSDKLGLKAAPDGRVVTTLDSVERLWAPRKVSLLLALEKRDAYMSLIHSVEETYQRVLEEALLDTSAWLTRYRKVTITHIIMALVATVVGALIFILWSVWLSNRFTWRPIKDLKTAIVNFERGKDVEALSINRSDEVGELAQMFYRVLKGRLNEVERLVRFGNLINDEISEKECYNILINFLTATFEIDRIIAVSFNNSENLSEVIASYERNPGEMPLTADTPYELSAIKEPQLCRVVRSGLQLINDDVNEEYRCPEQEVAQEAGSCGCYPVSVGGAVLGWIHLASCKPSFFDDKSSFIINSYLGYMAPAISSIRLINAHRKLAVKDPLTGLYNRRFLEETLERNIAIACRYGQPLSILMIDVDHFKRFNDLYGHSHGDKVLQTIAKILMDNARETDAATRYGGEEFTIVLPNTDKDGAAIVAERIRKDVEENAVTTIEGNMESVTISLGVATCPDDTVEMDRLLKFADGVLYQSKAAGRNRVTLASHEALKVVESEESSKSSGLKAVNEE